MLRGRAQVGKKRAGCGPKAERWCARRRTALVCASKPPAASPPRRIRCARHRMLAPAQAAPPGVRPGPRRGSAQGQGARTGRNGRSSRRRRARPRPGSRARRRAQGQYRGGGSSSRSFSVVLPHPTGGIKLREAEDKRTHRGGFRKLTGSRRQGAVREGQIRSDQNVVRRR